MKGIVFILLFIFSYAQPLALTSQEKEILKKHPLKCISTGEWAPFNLIEHGKLTGIGYDYWKVISERLNIKDDCRIVKNWHQVLTEIEHKTADMTLATKPTPKRLEYARFSKPYVTYPIVIVTKNDVGFIDDIDLLKGKTIAVGKGYAVVNILKKHYPALKIRYVENIDNALDLIDKGKVFATIEILPVVAYKLNENQFFNLKISGSIPYYFPLSIMLRKEHETLLPLINKAIDSISKEERDKINKPWIVIHYDEKISSRYFYILLLGSICIVLVFAIWLFLLKKEIRQKNSIEQRLKKLAHIDSLTSIFNRYMLDVTLDKEIALVKRHGNPLSVIFFDIDGFKNINDTYGHNVGDSILSELSRLISNSIRESDIFGRWGGDEFLLICLETKEEDALHLAGQLNRIIERHTFKKHVNVTCSFGVTSYREGDTRQCIMARVDRHFYEVKRSKREMIEE
jgi:polar amino acid transport system substrate-binding protein